MFTGARSFADYPDTAKHKLRPLCEAPNLNGSPQVAGFAGSDDDEIGLPG